MFNDPRPQIATGLRYHLKLLESDLIPQFLKCRENFFRALQIAILQFSSEISEHSKVARSDVWRVGWMGSSENLQVTEFIDKSMLIVPHRVAQVRRKIDHVFRA
jgi:hypothetical protein